MPDRGPLGPRTRRTARACIVVALALLPGGLAAAEEPAVGLHGGWVATGGGGQVFRGRWSAEATPGDPNTVKGAWTLLGQGDESVLEGTWSARKAGRGWTGTWAARAQTGQTFSGTWQAPASELRGRTFEDLLRRTAEKQIAGTWRSGGAHGRWWLKG